MKPENARVWRKTRRAAEKCLPTGRRTTHRVETQTPKPRSTWEQLLNRRNTSDGA